jgi:hypothetical protein
MNKNKTKQNYKAMALLTSEDLLALLDAERAAFHNTEKQLISARKEIVQMKIDMAALAAQNTALKVLLPKKRMIMILKY